MANWPWNWPWMPPGHPAPSRAAAFHVPSLEEVGLAPQCDVRVAVPELLGDRDDVQAGRDHHVGGAVPRRWKDTRGRAPRLHDARPVAETGPRGLYAFKIVADAGRRPFRAADAGLERCQA